MSRWKVLPHRLADGRCRDCGRLVATTAPQGCPRCAIERAFDEGMFTILNPVVAFEDQGRELWSEVAMKMRSGKIRSGHFYIWIGHGDGLPLEQPIDELLSNEQEFANASTAQETALDLARRYPQVWVITTVGGWCVTTHPVLREK
jgi:hypothetical protein